MYIKVKILNDTTFLFVSCFGNSRDFEVNQRGCWNISANWLFIDTDILQENVKHILQ